MPDTIVPVIDISGWNSGEGSERDRIASEFGHACETVGFLQLVGHGLSEAAIAGLYGAADELFALPLDRKLELGPPRPAVNRGYAAKGSESLSYSLGQASPPDLFEAFNVGVDVPGEDDDVFYPDNIWPAELATFRPAVERYLGELAVLTQQIQGIIENALQLPAGFFTTRTDRSVDVFRIIRYQREAGEAPALDNQMRMGAHTDYGIFTILLADQVPGLQIVAPDGAWLDVVPATGAVVINIGDALAIWTNDRWRSTLHRVLPPTSGNDDPALRRSFAFFHDGNVDAVIECLPSCVEPGSQPKYAPVTIREHLLNKILAPRELIASTVTQTASDRLPV